MYQLNQVKFKRNHTSEFSVWDNILHHITNYILSYRYLASCARSSTIWYISGDDIDVAMFQYKINHQLRKSRKWLIFGKYKITLLYITNIKLASSKSIQTQLHFGHMWQYIATYNAIMPSIKVLKLPFVSFSPFILISSVFYLPVTNLIYPFET